MIPRAHIQEWAATTPWRELRQVEQDLIICRALCDIFNEPFLAGRLAFRGGTAIHKLLFRQPLRYSEDLDLVQVHAEPIGPTVNALRDVLDDREVQKALVAQPAARGGNLLVIEPPGPLAIPQMDGDMVPAAPDLLAYAELRYRGTGQAQEAAEMLLPKVLGDAAA